MTQYLRQNDTYHLAPDVSGVAIDNLPAGYYRICFHPKVGYWLQITDPMKIIPKAYGNAYQHQDRIMETFAERDSIPTTVMLEGFKGTGKTLLAKKLCVDFVEKEGGIVILQSDVHTGDAYKGFLQKIKQKKIVFIDEFDKVYTRTEEINDMLTLLDGMYPQHAMFILTMNADSRSTKYEYFHNRPGRVYYNLKFGSISESTIREYAADNLNDATRVDEMVEFIGRFSMFNMDMLTVLVHEMNKSGGNELTVRQMAEFLNIKPTVSYDLVRLQYEVIYKGYDVTDIVSREYMAIDKLEEAMQNPENGLRILIRNNSVKQGPDGKPIVIQDEDGDNTHVPCLAVKNQEGKRVELEALHEVIKGKYLNMKWDAKTRVLTFDSKEHDVQVTVCAQPSFSYLNKDTRILDF